MFSKLIFNMSNCVSLCHVLLHVFFLDLVIEILFWKLQKLLVSIKGWNRRFSCVSVLTQQTALHDTSHNIYRRSVTPFNNNGVLCIPFYFWGWIVNVHCLKIINSLKL